MGIIIDSCKRTIACCESDDEKGYKKRVYTKKIESESDNDDNDEEEKSDPEDKEKTQEVPQKLDDIKIKTDKIFKQRHQDPWNFYEELEELGVGNYGVVKKVRLIKNNNIRKQSKWVL